MVPLNENDDTDVALSADKFFYATKSHFIRDYTRWMLTIFEWMPGIFLLIPFARFTVLPENLQIKFLQKFANSRIGLFRLLFFAVKTVVMQAYYQTKPSWDDVNYSGPWVKDNIVKKKFILTEN